MASDSKQSVFCDKLKILYKQYTDVVRPLWNAYVKEYRKLFKLLHHAVDKEKLREDYDAKTAEHISADDFEITNVNFCIKMVLWAHIMEDDLNLDLFSNLTKNILKPEVYAENLCKDFFSAHDLLINKLKDMFPFMAEFIECMCPVETSNKSVLFSAATHMGNYDIMYHVVEFMAEISKYTCVVLAKKNDDGEIEEHVMPALKESIE